MSKLAGFGSIFSWKQLFTRQNLKYLSAFQPWGVVFTVLSFFKSLRFPINIQSLTKWPMGDYVYSLAREPLLKSLFISGPSDRLPDSEYTRVSFLNVKNYMNIFFTANLLPMVLIRTRRRGLLLKRHNKSRGTITDTKKSRATVPLVDINFFLNFCSWNWR
jgi:hypothetical protein